MPSADGAAAQQKLEWTRVDLVICDGKLPQVDGVELCRLFKGADRTRDLPIVMLTSLKGPAKREAALGCGADEYITKPFERNVLLKAIERLSAAS